MFRGLVFENILVEVIGFLTHLMKLTPSVSLPKMLGSSLGIPQLTMNIGGTLGCPVGWSVMPGMSGTCAERSQTNTN